jgi:twinkle protein
MFNNYDEFTQWLEISKNFDSQTIKDIYTFIDRFPYADFNAYINASKRLAKGDDIRSVISRYKKHLQSVGEVEGDDYVEVSRMDDEDMLDRLLEAMHNGQLKGETTNIDLIDEAWKWRKSEFTLFTGYNNDGKSLFIRFLCLVKGIVDGWKSAYYAPEDYPDIAFFDELMHTASGYSTDKDRTGFIGDALYKEVYHQIKPHFVFVNIRPPKNTLEAILTAFVPLIEKEGVRICIIDPMVKITRPKEYVNNDAGWSAYVTAVCTDFARRYNICLMLVLHQLTPKIQENGTYPKPDKYSIKSGGNLSDSSDNVLFLQRPEAPRNLEDTLVRFGSLKIKKQKLVAIPKEVMFKFNRKTNRYVHEETGEDLFNFDSYLDIPRMGLLNFKA